MRVTSILVAASFALFANAQTSTQSTPASTSVDAAQASQSALQAEILKCIKACPDGDVKCQSKCNPVPSPNESQVNATNTCVAACPQGNGTEADIANYSNCVSGCIAANYYTSSIGTPEPTGSAGNGNNGGNGGSSGSGDSNGNGNGNGGSSGTNNQQASGSGTATGSAASSTSRGAAAAATAGLMGVGSGVVGVVGFMAAVMAL